jgi:predicted ArsR family transcriptional regulator
MQATRQRILDYLEARGTATTRQTSQAFGMTAQNVRRHLQILEGRGLVAALPALPAEGRGRPEARYALAAQSQDSNLAGLASALLDGLPDSELQRAGKQLAGNASASRGQVTQRLVAASRRLAELGYKPRWEARPNRPEVVFGRCPYAAIIAEHPELCKMDAVILQDMLGAEVEQISKLQPGPQGTPQCVFQVLNSK